MSVLDHFENLQRYNGANLLISLSCGIMSYVAHRRSLIVASLRFSCSS